MCDSCRSLHLWLTRHFLDGKRPRLSQDTSGEAADGVGLVEGPASNAAERRRSAVSAAIYSTRSTPTESVDERGQRSEAGSQVSLAAAPSSSATTLHATTHETQAGAPMTPPVALTSPPRFESSYQRTMESPREREYANVLRGRAFQMSAYSQYQTSTPQLPSINSTGDFLPPPQSSSALQGMPLRAIMLADAPPALRVLPAPVAPGPPSMLGPDRRFAPISPHEHSPARRQSQGQSRSHGQDLGPNTEFPRQDTALAALLRASELVRDEQRPRPGPPSSR